MTRTQVIEKLHEYTSSLNIPNGDITVDERILDILEELGMAPPEITETVKTSVIVATPFGYQEQVVEDSKVFVRRWEKEDGE